MKEKLRKFFSKKINLYLTLCILIFILLTSGIYLFLYFSFELNGSRKVNINYKGNYKDEGYKQNYLTKNIKTDNKVNTSKLGSYKVTYTANYFGVKIKKTRIVNVVDHENPVIELIGLQDINVCPNTEYIEEGYIATDNYDGDITDKVKIIRNSDKIIYTVKDTNGNEFTTERILNIKDIEAPIIKLKGGEKVSIKNSSKYNDPGYEVSDNCDSNINVNIESNLNINKNGKYEISYIATDLSGNTSTIKREITVYSEIGKGVIYLTFDDGPSNTGTTEKILNVLKEENVKATFFVTNKGSDNLIRREYNEGHQIALHTATHDYSYIYSSYDNYFNDLESVSKRVYNITGNNTYIIRFPGGSNNTVSNKYNYGIMDTLTKMVVEKGYSYFDWNVSGEDAGGCTTSTCVYNNVVKGLSKKRPNIVLLHDIKSTTSNALKDIIQYAKNNGYSFDVLTPNSYSVRFK